jgi:GT2 family glycosyltransferase
VTEIKIYVVIVNYFSSTMIAELLDTLGPQESAGVAVVDNSENCDEFENLKRITANYDVTPIQMSRNVGFGAAVNVGVRRLNPDEEGCVWILNPDTIVSRTAAVQLSRSISDGEADMASPVIVTGDGDDVWFGGGRFDSRLGRTSHWKSRPTALMTCNFLTAAAVMISVAAWNRLGGFREDLFMYWEDADLCLRANELGLRMVVDPSISIWHAVGATTSSEGKSALYYYYMQRNRMLVLRDRYGRQRLFAIGIAVETLLILSRAVREPVGRIEKSGAALRGIKDGIRATWR